jgi:putative endonuclease
VRHGDRGADPPPALSLPEVVAVRPKDELGHRGEQVAADYLERAGFRILDRNWRCPEGEIDIVAAEQQILVICEVKTRSGTRFGTPAEAVTRVKRGRLRRLAVRWLVAHGVLFDEVRIDVIALLADQAGNFTIEHVRGVG